MRRSRGELRRRRLVTPDLFLLFLELADEALFVDCATAAGASAAKPAHKIKSASTPTDCQRLRTTLYLLSPKIGAHNGTVVFGQAAYQFVIEIIAARGRCCYAYRFGFCNCSRFLDGSRSHMLWSMPGKGIRVRRNRLRLRRGLCSFLDRSVRSAFLRRLLAQRNNLQPGAGCCYQQLQ